MSFICQLCNPIPRTGEPNVLPFFSLFFNNNFLVSLSEYCKDIHTSAADILLIRKSHLFLEYKVEPLDVDSDLYWFLTYTYLSNPEKDIHGRKLGWVIYNFPMNSQVFHMVLKSSELDFNVFHLDL